MITVSREVRLAPYTTFGIGGAARYFVDAGSSADLVEAVAWAHTRRLPVVVIGRGANVLVGDGGVEGLVVRTAAGGGVEVLEDGCVRAEAGVVVDRLIGVSLAHGLSGLEHFAGIPSTLGGALRQNLHFLSPDRRRTVFVGDLVEQATVLTAGGPRTVSGAHFCFGYDTSALQQSDEILLDVTLRLRRGDQARMRRVRRQNLLWRARRHPAAADRRSAGCVFRNPAGVAAARLIDEAGLKGLRVGGAVVSRRHANFVLNVGSATAADVRTLIETVQSRVAQHSGRGLAPEIDFLGRF